MTVLDLRSGRADLRGHAGDDLTVSVTVTDGDGAVDLSGATVTASVLRRGSLVESFAVSIGGAGSNVATCTLTDTQTASIGIEQGLSWSFEVVDGDVRQYAGGSFRLYDPGDPAGTASTDAVTVTLAGSVGVTLTVAAGGGGGAVDSVNGQTGTVVLDADDIDDAATTNKFATQAQLDIIDSISDAESVQTIASSGASLALDVDYDIFEITVDDNCAISFTNVPAVRTVQLRFNGDGVATRTVTLPGSQTIDVAADDADLVVVAQTVDTGSTWQFYYTGEPSLSAPVSSVTTQADWFEFAAFSFEEANTNWQTFSAVSSAPYNYVRNSTGAQNASLTFRVPIPLQGGSWSLRLWHQQSNNRGIYTIEGSVDGSTWATIDATIDGYNATATVNRGTLTGVAIADGVKYIRFTMATQNPSSSGHYGSIFGMSGKRTGA